jgi:histidinol-phosphatase
VLRRDSYRCTPCGNQTEPVASTDPVAAELALALELADLADAVSQKHFRRPTLLVETKADFTPVSEADREVEQVLRRRIADARPTHAIVGEEFGQAVGERAGGPRWIIDPIDGTRKFVRGMFGWATLIALEDAGEVIVGVASAPAIGRRWWAARGLGAFADGQPIHVSNVRTLAESHVAHGSLEGWVRAGRAAQLADVAVQSWGTSGYGDFWIHMLVAEGAAEVALEIEAAVWDLAAPKVIVEEAGGRFTDVRGAVTAEGGNAVSSNGRVHDAVLRLLS